MPTTAGETILTQIATAIRSKSPAPFNVGAIHITNFSQRILRIPRPATDNTMKLAVFATEKTATEMTNEKLVRCNGHPAFETPSMAIYDGFRRTEWQVSDFPPTFTLPSRNYERQTLVGDKLFLGMNTVGTVLVCIDTKTGVVTEITGLPSRFYRPFAVIGNRWLYAMTYHTTNINTIVRIDSTNLTFTQISLTPTTSRRYDRYAILGQRIFFGWSEGTAGTDLPFIDTGVEPPVAGSVTGLASRMPAQLFAVNNKLFVASDTAATAISVISAAGTAPNYSGALTVPAAGQITGLPSRTYDVFFAAGNFLYVGSTAEITSILRIQHATTNNTWTEVQLPGSTPLPNRRYRIFTLVGAAATGKIYVGSTTLGTSLIVITNSTGAAAEIADLPSRAYSQFQVSGTKLYCAASAASTTLVVINTTNDTPYQIAGLISTHNEFRDPEFRVPGRPSWLPQDAERDLFAGALILDRTNLYLFNSNGSTTSMTVINTNTDMIRARLTGFPSERWTTRTPVPPSRVNPEGGMYLGTVGDTTRIMEVDYATVNEAPSEAHVPVVQITGLPSRAPHYWGYANGKIYINGAINGVNTTRITCLSKSILPNSGVGPPFMYVRY